MNPRIARQTCIELNVPTDPDARHIHNRASAGRFKIHKVLINFLEHPGRVKVLLSLWREFPAWGRPEKMFMETRCSQLLCVDRAKYGVYLRHFFLEDGWKRLSRRSSLPAAADGPVPRGPPAPTPEGTCSYGQGLPQPSYSYVHGLQARSPRNSLSKAFVLVARITWGKARSPVQLRPMGIPTMV